MNMFDAFDLVSVSQFVYYKFSFFRCCNRCTHACHRSFALLFSRAFSLVRITIDQVLFTENRSNFQNYMNCFRVWKWNWHRFRTSLFIFPFKCPKRRGMNELKNKCWQQNEFYFACLICVRLDWFFKRSVRMFFSEPKKTINISQQNNLTNFSLFAYKK